jgi:hypothetical protein
VENMKKIRKKYGLIFVAFVAILFVASSATSLNIVYPNNKKYNQQFLTEEIDDDRYLQEYAECLLKSPYKIDIYAMTIGEVKQLIYRELFKKNVFVKNRKLFGEINSVFNTLEENEISSDMSIAQAKKYIQENRERIFQGGPLGFNLLCSIDVAGIGTTFPIIRLFKAIRGSWWFWEYLGTAEIDGLLGRQYADEHTDSPGESFGGSITILLGGIGCLGREPRFGFPIAVVFGFALISRSDVPFV